MKKNETKALLDTALHPVRMHILNLFLGGEGLTPQQMAERLSDIPQATLYRHINRLLQSGLLAVMEERPVRGTVEKVYALNRNYQRQLVAGQDAVEAFSRMSKEDHIRYFTAFTLALMDDFSRYLDLPGPRNFAADGVGYHKLLLNLSDEEFAAFAAALNQSLMPFIGLPDAPGRKKRWFTTIMMPSDETLETNTPPESSGGTDEPDHQKE